jgi:chaperone BCS1
MSSLAQQALSAFGGNSKAANTIYTGADASATLASATDLTSLVAALWLSLGPLRDWLKILVFGSSLEILRRFLFFARDRLTASLWITANFDENDSSYGLSFVASHFTKFQIESADWMMVWLSKQPAWGVQFYCALSAHLMHPQHKPGMSRFRPGHLV